MKMNIKRKENPKIAVLFQSWININHSYACVNCFQLIHLYKNFKDYIDIYVQEMPYFRKEWENSKKLVYTTDYNEILSNLKIWDKNTHIDLVYSITYPYNITNIQNYLTGKNIPKCVFYTAEFANLDTSFFYLQERQNTVLTDEIIKNYFKENKHIHTIAPSNWSANGMIKYHGVSNSNNHIITHGVDTTIFKKHKDNLIRNKIRNFYNVKDTDILFLHMGSMTGNKGMLLMIQVMNILVNKMNKKHFKLLLKGSGNLYQSKMFVDNYFHVLLEQKAMTIDEYNNLINKHIIYIDKSFSFEQINNYYNAADVYVSPYLCEGFNLSPLESLSSGTSVLVPRTGSTKEYIDDIYTNYGKDFIYYIDSNMIQASNGNIQNNITIENILNTILSNEHNFHKNKNEEMYTKMLDFIEKEYSWNKVSQLMYNCFSTILNK